RKLNRMRLAKRESDYFALQLRAVTDADNIELLLEARSDAVHCVGNQGASQAVQRPVLLRSALRRQDPILLLEGNPMRHGDRKFPLGALHFDLAILQRDLYARGHGNWFVSDT